MLLVLTSQATLSSTLSHDSLTCYPWVKLTQYKSVGRPKNMCPNTENAEKLYSFEATIAKVNNPSRLVHSTTTNGQARCVSFLIPMTLD